MWCHLTHLTQTHNVNPNRDLAPVNPTYTKYTNACTDHGVACDCAMDKGPQALGAHSLTSNPAPCVDAIDTQALPAWAALEGDSPWTGADTECATGPYTYPAHSIEGIRTLNASWLCFAYERTDSPMADLAHTLMNGDPHGTDTPPADEWGDLFSTLNDSPERTRPKDPVPETDKVTQATERANAASHYRAVASRCKVCGGPKGRPYKGAPMMCPHCNPTAWARASETSTPTPEQYLTLYQGKRAQIEAPSVPELALLCTLATHDEWTTNDRTFVAYAVLTSTLVSAQRSKGKGKLTPSTFTRVLRTLLSRRWIGRSRHHTAPHFCLTDKGRAAMRAALTLTLSLPTPPPT
jgi:DNA-binding MarR family transcriptional regulator